MLNLNLMSATPLQIFGKGQKETKSGNATFHRQKGSWARGESIKKGSLLIDSYHSRQNLEMTAYAHICNIAAVSILLQNKGECQNNWEEEQQS